MKYTLLDLTQTILSDMDSDEVNSITDTAESRQVAGIIKETYFNIIARAKLPELQSTFSLDASADPTQPVLMTKPDNVTRIDWIKYFNEDQDLREYTYVSIVSLEQFLDMTQQTNTDQTNTGSMTFQDKTYYYTTDRQPTMCAIIGNFYLIFNSYNSAIDTTLQSSKTLCFGQVVPDFTLSDVFVPSLDDQQFPLLLNEAKSACFLQLKQIANDTSEREAKRQWTSLNKNKFLANKPSDFDQLPSFGRTYSGYGSKAF